MNYIKMQTSNPRIICDVCGRQLFLSHYEICKNDKKTIICSECVDDIIKSKDLVNEETYLAF